MGYNLEGSKLDTARVNRGILKKKLSRKSRDSVLGQSKMKLDYSKEIQGETGCNEGASLWLGTWVDCNAVSWGTGIEGI